MSTEAQGIASVVEAAFTLYQAGVERGPIQAKVREMEAAGATPDAITDALQAMRKESEAADQQAIDKMP
jgi:hypothetical protein